MARVDLIGEIEIAIEPERNRKLREIAGLRDGFSELERKEVKPDLRGVAVDFVNMGEQRLDRALPGCRIMLFEK
jgi:hypothetical protein